MTRNVMRALGRSERSLEQLGPFPHPATGANCYCPVSAFADTTREVTCKRRFCPRCGVRWALDWRDVTGHNLRQLNAPVAMISVTAPGADMLPWACGIDHVHSGRRGCQVDREYADAWSRSAPERWRKLWPAARRAVERRTGLKPAALLRVWEPQRRGVPHVHVIVGMGTSDERAAAQALVEELTRLAPEYFFGFVDRKLKPISAEKAATYLASYLMGRAGRARKKPGIRENIADPRMPRSLIWLTPKLTTQTLVTMRRMRYARWALAAIAGRCDVLPALRGVFAVEIASVCARLRPRPREGEDDDEADDEADELARRRDDDARWYFVCFLGFRAKPARGRVA